MHESDNPAPGAGIDLGAARRVVADLTWRACTPEYAAKVGPHEYVVRHKTCDEASWETLVAAIEDLGADECYLVTGNTFRYLVLDDHRYWTAPGWTVLNRALQSDVAGLYGPPGPPWSGA